MEDKDQPPQSTWEIHYEKFGEKLHIKVTGTAQEGWNPHATGTLRELIQGISNHQPTTTFLDPQPTTNQPLTQPTTPSTNQPALSPAPEQFMLPPARTPLPIEPPPEQPTVIQPTTHPPTELTQLELPAPPEQQSLKEKLTLAWWRMVLCMEATFITLAVIMVFSVEVRTRVFSFFAPQPTPTPINKTPQPPPRNGK